MSRDNQTFVRFELGIVMFELVQRVTKYRHKKYWKFPYIIIRNDILRDVHTIIQSIKSSIVEGLCKF